MQVNKGNLHNQGQEHNFLDGSVRKVVKLRTAILGYGTYEPGWTWSKHAGPQSGKSSENHVGYIISGEMMIRDREGVETKLGPGDGFEVTPGHDAWVVGNTPCIAMDFSHINGNNNKQ